MKAKEYAKEISVLVAENKMEEVERYVSKVTNDLVEDWVSIIKARKITQVSAAKAVSREVNDKWNAICRRVNTDQLKVLRPNGFIIMLRAWAKDKPAYQQFVDVERSYDNENDDR